MYEHRYKYLSIQKYITIDVESSYRNFVYIHLIQVTEKFFDAIKKGLNCFQKCS